MVEPSRYKVSEEDSENGVLKNKLGIKDQKNLEDTETILLNDTYNHFFELLQKEKLRFDIKLIFDIHKYFLETIYVWAGRVRSVEISKNGVLFCAHLQIQEALKNFEKILTQNLPSFEDTKKEVSKKLAVIHCEFNAIHPFREGNGRTIRLFLDLIAVSLGFNLIDFSKNSQEIYIEACRLGMAMDYKKMSNIIYDGLRKLG